MSKFKVGDKVRRTRDSASPRFFGRKGKVYTVLSVGTNTIEVIPGELGAEAGYFELVEEAMKYENKWILNEGQDIPPNADKLEKDGSVVAYRLPIREIKAGDKVVTSGIFTYEVLFVHGDWVAVYLDDPDYPRLEKKTDLTLVD